MVHDFFTGFQPELPRRLQNYSMLYPGKDIITELPLNKIFMY